MTHVHSPAPSGVSNEALEAHAGWLSSGKDGEGRIRLHGRRIERDLSGRDLRGATFEECDFDGADLSEARLDEARFERCSFEGTDLRRASAIDTRFEGCDLRRAAVAGLRIGPTGFLRCRFGDFASQTVGRPDVFGPYVVISPDTSNLGDGTRISHPAEIDERWYAPPGDGLERRFTLESEDGVVTGVKVLHMHLGFFHRPARLRLEIAHQTFDGFLERGAPGGFASRLPEELLERVRQTVESLQEQWTPDPE